jgi:NAD(P)-dependent dehydrogenase (short-subunit alcohol dehydrogenase family)
MTEKYRATLTDDGRVLHDAALRRNPLGRVGAPETDVAPVLVFLVSDASQFITAQIIAIDGGATPVR